MEPSDLLFSAIWHPHATSSPDPPVAQCLPAQRFAAWAEEICKQAVESKSLVSIAQTKVLLVDKLFEWRSCVPRSHRNRIGEQGHFCIWHVFEAAYLKLRIAELSLTPPMLFLPPPPPPPPAKIVKVYKVDGFPIGEMEEDEEE